MRDFTIIDNYYYKTFLRGSLKGLLCKNCGQETFEDENVQRLICPNCNTNIPHLIDKEIRSLGKHEKLKRWAKNYNPPKDKNGWL